MTVKKPDEDKKTETAAKIMAAGIKKDAAEGRIGVLDSLAKGGGAALANLIALLAVGSGTSTETPAQTPAANVQTPEPLNKAANTEPDGDEGKGGEGDGDGDEGGGKEPDGDEGGGKGDGDGDDDEAAGYEDMNLAVYQGPDGSTLVDVSEWLERQGATTEGSRVAMLKALTKVEELGTLLKAATTELRNANARIESLEKAVARQNVLTAAIGSAIAEDHVALAKGITLGFETLLQVPAPAVDFTRPPQRPAAGGTAAYIGGSPATERAALAKALRLNVISDLHIESHRRTRQLSDNPVEAERLYKAVADLV